MAGGHGHGEPPYRVPHHSTWADYKGLWQLQELEKALAKHGLKDPWIRNEAWRYNPAFGNKVTRARAFFFRGFGIGLALTVATVAVEQVLGGGGGHDHEGDDHH